MSQGSKSRYRLVKHQPRQQTQEDMRIAKERALSDVKEEIERLRRRGVIPNEQE